MYEYISSACPKISSCVLRAIIMIDLSPCLDGNTISVWSEMWLSNVFYILGHYGTYCTCIYTPCLYSVTNLDASTCCRYNSRTTQCSSPLSRVHVWYVLRSMWYVMHRCIKTIRRELSLVHPAKWENGPQSYDASRLPIIPQDQAILSTWPVRLRVLTTNKSAWRIQYYYDHYNQSTMLVMVGVAQYMVCW